MISSLDCRRAPLALLALSLLDFARVTAPVPLQFPRDHGAHPDYRTEWWYVTGNVDAANGDRFGFQLTFFRTAVTPSVADRPSRFAVRDLSFAHLALTDVARGEFFFDDRTDRGSLGTAGAAADGLHVWLRDWRADERDGALVLQAGSGVHRLALTLAPQKPIVLHGDRGFSRKGPAEGNATIYTSLTRCGVRGTLSTSGAGEVEVTGLAWLDHEFGSKVLPAEQVGWDWFGLQLDDGSELMLEEARQQGGPIEGRSFGTLVRPDGSTRSIAHDEITIEGRASWRSPHSGATYPGAWRISVPSEGIDLEVDPLLADQELRTMRSTGVTYWEGCCAITGRHGERRVRGRGYVELVGYAGRVAWF